MTRWDWTTLIHCRSVHQNTCEFIKRASLLPSFTVHCNLTVNVDYGKAFFFKYTCIQDAVL